MNRFKYVMAISTYLIGGIGIFCITLFMAILSLIFFLNNDVKMCMYIGLGALVSLTILITLIRFFEKREI